MKVYKKNTPEQKVKFRSAAERRRMLKLFKQFVRETGKSVLPNPNIEYRLVFKRDAVNIIKRAKGWRTDAEMARALGLTRAYVSMLIKTRVSVTSTVITRLAAQMGNIAHNWHIYFELVPRGVSDPNHPVWNAEKYNGMIPYDHYSLNSEMRKLDYKTEDRE